MADSSALTLIREFQFGPFIVREMTGTADDQAAVAFGGGLGQPDMYFIQDFLDSEVACAITAVSATTVTYGAAATTTAKLWLIWEAQAAGGIS